MSWGPNGPGVQGDPEQVLDAPAQASEGRIASRPVRYTSAQDQSTTEGRRVQ